MVIIEGLTIFRVPGAAPGVACKLTWSKKAKQHKRELRRTMCHAVPLQEYSHIQQGGPLVAIWANSFMSFSLQMAG